MTTLFEITGRIADLEAYLDHADESELSDAQRAEAIKEVLDDIELDRDEKVDGYCWIIDKLQGQAEIIKHEEQRLAARRRSIERNVERLKEGMFLHMQALREKKITTAYHTVSIQNAGGKLAMRYDDTLLPASYKQPKTVIVIREDELRQDLEAGKPVPGAMLLPRKEILRIR